MISEREMENLVISNPEKYIGEEGLKLVSQQYHIGKYYFDLLFEDRHGAKLIVELQKGTLDRDHTYKILDYYDEYKEAHPNEFIELMVIANAIPLERRKRLSAWGITYKEIPLSDFIANMNVTPKSTSIEMPTPVTISTPENTSVRYAENEGTESSVLGSYELFKMQKNLFINAVKGYDPSIITKMDWKDLSKNYIRTKQNWFVMFYPSSWIISQSQVSGVHFGFCYYSDKKTQDEKVRLSVGVEKPMPDEYKAAFKDEVVEEIHRRKINLTEFDLWPNAGLSGKVKLLEVKVQLNNQSWEKAFEYYRKLEPFISIVSEKIQDFKNKGFIKAEQRKLQEAHRGHLQV